MKITSKGQVTIPQDLRERFGLLPHTEVEFVPAADGQELRLRKAASDARLYRTFTLGSMPPQKPWRC